MPNFEEILTASWRAYPAIALVAAGLWLCVRGMGLHRAIVSGARDPHRALEVARSFRVGIAGLCFIGGAVGWSLSMGWVVIVALIILGEEMLETSTMIAALRDGVARQAAAANPTVD